MKKQPLFPKQKLYWPDNMEYFLTTSTYLHYPYFKEDNQKQIVLNKIKEVKQVLSVPVLAYSIAINHFHLKFFLELGKNITKIKNILHSGISREYRKRYKVPYEKFWQQARIFYIKDDEASWKISGYINGNLLKHREESTFEELKNNQFTSFWNFRKVYGDKEARRVIYNVIDISESAEGEIDINSLNKLVISKKPEPLPRAG
ncbi:hypothetical protein HQ544_00590 [Candidatus Falkowbacteria bacterium]|nr:hypothetical protein [Candidatus Falkowbacteria bacterium]